LFKSKSALLLEVWRYEAPVGYHLNYQVVLVDGGYLFLSRLIYFILLGVCTTLLVCQTCRRLKKSFAADPTAYSLPSYQGLPARWPTAEYQRKISI